MQALITSILEFFRVVWDYIVALFFFYRKDSAPDIEARIITTDLKQPPELVNVVEVGKNGFSPIHGQSHSSGFIEKDSDRAESTSSDHSRRPSHRRFAIDPVKSRIVDSTFNKVQDRTFNVVKPVIITHNTVVASCSTKVEYNGLPEEGARTAPKRERINYAGNREQFAEVHINRPEECDRKKYKNTINNLLNMFPLPPSRIPPPVATRQSLDEVIPTDARRRPALCASHDTTKRSSSSSSSESATSSVSSGSASYDTTTTQTSAPSTPGSAHEPFSPVAPTSAEIDVHEDDVYGFPVASKIEILLWPAKSMCEDELRISREPVEVDQARLSVRYALALWEQAAADEVTASIAYQHCTASGSSSFAHLVGEDEDLTPYICPEFAFDYDVFVEFDDRNVAAYACTSSANLGGQTPAKAPPQEQEFDQGEGQEQPTTGNMPDVSPSQEAIVDFLLSQLETSFESDDEKQGSAGDEGSLDWCAERGFDREVGCEYGDFASVEHVRGLPFVFPLHIVKQNKLRPVQPVAEEEEEEEEDASVNRAQDEEESDPERVITGHWEESMANALKAFREAGAEDDDFRELFYKDSSFFFETSCTINGIRYSRRDSVASSNNVYDPERLKRLNESFEKLKRSIEQMLSELDQMSDHDDEVIVESEDEVESVFLSDVKDLGQEDPKDDASSVSDYSDSDEGGGVDGVDPCRWVIISDDEDEDDSVDYEQETGDGGVFDHWSDILELDDYSTTIQQPHTF